MTVSIMQHGPGECTPARRDARSAGQLRTGNLGVERDRDPVRDLTLQGAQIARVVVEPLRPNMRVGLRIDQLNVDADLFAPTLHASFQHIAHPQLAADPPGVDRLVSIGERSVPRDHEHARDPR